MFIKSLDTLCPTIMTSSTLQEKVFRIVLATEIDAMMIDIDACVIAGKLTISCQEIISTKEAIQVFGKFTVPPDILL
jgi:hypothetical protein